MIENDDTSNPVPVKPLSLRYHQQPITFSHAIGESTGNTYPFKPGMLKPFETIGVDTAWELSLDPITNMIDMRNIYDIQVVINYSARYSSNYEEYQKITTIDAIHISDYQILLCGPGYSLFGKILSMSFYHLHNPSHSIKGFRDIRIITFETKPDFFGPNEKNQK